MAVINVTDDAVNDLRVSQFFDPDADLDTTSPTLVTLSSHDGYELDLRGSGFTFDNSDAPTGGTITSMILYDPSGDVVGTISGLSNSLETYYDTVAVDNHVGSYVSDLLAGADKLIGHDASDYLEGYGGADSIVGGLGDDQLFGDDGADTISGGVGADDIDGGTGSDQLAGGDGEDLIYGYTGNDTISGGDNDDKLFGENQRDSLLGGSGYDSLYGGDGSDTLRGGDDDDSLEGGAGSDRLYGDNGNDFLGGGYDDDYLAGGSGKDTLVGDSGNDTLVGGAGGDSLTGGSGDDVFLFTSLSDRGDRIADFTHGDDHLSFKASGFAHLDANFSLVVDDHPVATSANDTFLFNTDTHRLYYDADGTGAGSEIFVTTLDHISTLSKSDFTIV